MRIFIAIINQVSVNTILSQMVYLKCQSNLLDILLNNILIYEVVKLAFDCLNF